MLSRAIASQGYLNRVLLNNTRASCLRLNTWHLPVSDVRCHSRTTWPFASLVKPNHQRSPLVSDVFRTESCHLSDIESRYLPHIRITKSCHLYYVRFYFSGQTPCTTSGESLVSTPSTTPSASGGTPSASGGTPSASGGTPSASGGTPSASGGTPSISGGTPSTTPSHSGDAQSSSTHLSPQTSMNKSPTHSLNRFNLIITQ